MRRPAAVCALALLFLLPAHRAGAQARYTNPVIFADYSDPDVVRVGDDYYLVASSFHAVPGLPILHSRDLVTWTILSVRPSAPGVAALRHAAPRRGRLGAKPPLPRRRVLDLLRRTRISASS